MASRDLPDDVRGRLAKIGREWAAARQKEQALHEEAQRVVREAAAGHDLNEVQAAQELRMGRHGRHTVRRWLLGKDGSTQE